MRRTCLIACFAFAVSLAAPAFASDTWWLLEREDDDFGNTDNWNNGNPENQEPYVSTSDAPVTPKPGDPADATAVFDEEMEVGQTYIGGWKSEFDGTPPSGHGDPLGHSGTLNIIDGLLETEENPNQPPCAYIRVGYRGGRGTVNQSGGTVKSCSGVSMNYGATDGNGTAIYNLSGGTIDSWGLDIGGQGFGFFDMTGGNVNNDSFDGSGEYTKTCETSEHTCSTSIGKGYHHPEARFVPGFGVMSQTAGTHETEVLELGFEEGSVGLYSLRESATLEVTERISIGYAGTGVVTVAGSASMTSPAIRVGTAAGGVGQLSVHTGSVIQTGTGLGTGMLIGKAGGGTGSLVLTGIGATVRATSFFLYDRSRFIVYLDSTTGHNSKVEVSWTATIYPNSEFFVKLYKGMSPFTPTTGQDFTILCAQTISMPSAPIVKTEKWRLNRIQNVSCLGLPGEELQAEYCPNLPSC